LCSSIHSPLVSLTGPFGSARNSLMSKPGGRPITGVSVGVGVRVSPGSTAVGVAGSTVAVTVDAGVSVTVKVAVALTLSVGLRVGVSVAVAVAGGLVAVPGVPRSPAEPGQTVCARVQVIGEIQVVRSWLAPSGMVRPLAPPHSTRSSSMSPGANRRRASVLLPRLMLLY
jgi:hypothetical protein